MIQALRHPYPKMERIIADTLGLPPQELWPERYNDDGSTNRRIGALPKDASQYSSRKNNVKLMILKGLAVDDHPFESYLKEMYTHYPRLPAGSHGTLMRIFTKGSVSTGDISRYFESGIGCARRHLLDLTSQPLSMTDNPPELVEKVPPLVKGRSFTWTLTSKGENLKCKYFPMLTGDNKSK